MRVLFVCSGNICRSPLGAQLLVARLGPAAGAFDVVSAGTIAEDGRGMDEQAAAQSTVRDGAPGAHRSRWLTDAEIADADLVLTAERSHRGDVVQRVPRAARRVFTIRQFARVLDGLEPSDLDGVRSPEELVAVAARLKNVVPMPEDQSVDDVADPYRRGDDVHERAAAAIDDAVTRIAAAFRPLRPLG